MLSKELQEKLFLASFILYVLFNQKKDKIKQNEFLENIVASDYTLYLALYFLFYMFTRTFEKATIMIFIYIMIDVLLFNPKSPFTVLYWDASFRYDTTGIDEEY